ncbi:hypothetical protein MC885_015190 [Smutsia gigantea]|nr:hypothetical protein MC885_015190 [Smutsia gigantea]
MFPSSSLESGYSGCPAAPPPQSFHPLHQRHITVPTSVPQQQVFALAEPKRKPSLFWHTFNKLTPFKKPGPEGDDIVYQEDISLDLSGEPQVTSCQELSLFVALLCHLDAFTSRQYCWKRQEARTLGHVRVQDCPVSSVQCAGHFMRYLS